MFRLRFVHCPSHQEVVVIFSKVTLLPQLRIDVLVQVDWWVHDGSTVQATVDEVLCPTSPKSIGQIRDEVLCNVVPMEGGGRVSFIK